MSQPWPFTEKVKLNIVFFFFTPDREFIELGKQKANDSASTLDDPMLGQDMAEGSHSVLLEVGCGPGNMMYPVRLRLFESRRICYLVSIANERVYFSFSHIGYSAEFDNQGTLLRLLQ